MAPPLLEIDSFLPVINHLSNVIYLADKSLHIQGAVSKADLDALLCYIRRVGTFILTDSSQGHTISLGTYIRLAQLSTPFFPSLNHLRITGYANSSLTPINLLLSNSLRSIELLNINHAQEAVLSSFLDTLADEYPGLTSIKLVSPLSPSVWENCLKFSHLRALELKDVFSDLHSGVFLTIGQTLPQLESFNLDARSANYSRVAIQVKGGRNLPKCPARARVSRSMESSKLHSDCRDHPRSISPQFEPMKSPRPKPAFLHLENLFITGGLRLIQDLVEYVSSSRLKELRLTLMRTERPYFQSGHEWERIDLETPVFVTCLEKVLSSWRHSLANIFIGQHEDYPGTLRPVYPTLPLKVFKKILYQPKLDRLEVSDWTIEFFIGSSYHSLAPFDMHPTFQSSSLKFLHLPVQGSIGEGLYVPSLRFIAESFPNLVSLQSRIVGLADSDLDTFDRFVDDSESFTLDGSDEPVCDPSKARVIVLSHGLEMLSVGSTFLSPDLKELLTVARHIFALFPTLREIRTHEGQNENQWVSIHDFVRAFQGVCIDHSARLS